MTMRQRLLIVALISAFLIFCFYTFSDSSDEVSSRFQDHLAKFSANQNSSKCLVHPPDPWDKSILAYIDTKKETNHHLNCESAKVQPELTYLDSEGMLHLKSSSVQINCQYRSYKKMEGNDVELLYSDWISFNKSVKISSEFIEVSCQRAWFPHTRIYSNNHNQIIPIGPPKQSPDLQNKPSVIIIVLDSVSHSNFRRNMGKSLKVLQSPIYNSFIFDGMTKVGDNSFNNAVAFLAGRWAASEFGDVKNHFDDKPLIWKNFQQNGYRTLYAEDYPGFNLFNYLSKGFQKQPVDHYFRPYWLNVYWSYVHRRSKNLCYGNNPLHTLQLNYLSQFLQKYQDQPKFSLAWFTELGHDWLNQVRLGDDDFAQFLTKHAKLLEESFLIVMSDHGHRFDSIRRTKIGRIEECLPFFSLKIPKKMRESDAKLVEILQNNTKKLSTFWDVYATLHHISTFSTSRQSSQEFASSPIRGTSLLTPLQDRNCFTADIPEEFCVCDPVGDNNTQNGENLGETEVDTNQPIVKLILSDFLAEINKLLYNHTQCSQLTLAQTHSATKIGSDRYRLTIEVSPSKAIFEALVYFDAKIAVTKIIGDIRRINKYANQSICVNDQFLRKLCFCTTFIDSVNK